jgi:hypothetical protein
MTEKEEGEILALIRTLFREFQKAEQTKNFPVFSPLRAWIDAKGRVQFEIADTTNDVAVSLKSIGVTIYHLIMGESEVTKESYRLDGYQRRPIRTEYWPIIEYLLSGRATDASIIKKRLGWWRQFSDWRDKLSKAVTRFFTELFARRKGTMVLGSAVQPELRKKPARNILDGPSEPIDAIRHDIYASRRRLLGLAKIKMSGKIVGKCFAFAISLLISLLAAVQFCINVNERYSENTIWAIIVTVASLLLTEWLALTLARIASDFKGVIVFPIINSLYFFLTIVIVSLPPKDSSKDFFVVMDRVTNDFVARLVKDKDDELARFEGWFVNPFKYRLEQGVPLKGTLRKVYNLQWQGQEKRLPVQIEYRLDVVNRTEYSRALSAWRNQDRLEKEITGFFDGLDRRMNDYWRILNNENKESASDKNYLQAMMQVKMMDFLRRKVHERGLLCDEPLKTQLVCRTVDNVESCAEAPVPADRIELWKTHCEQPEKRDIPFVQLYIM